MARLRLGKNTRGALLATVMAGLLTATAGADNGFRHRGRSRADADIDSLKAELRPDRHGWQLLVKYEVEIEDARRGEAFDLVLQLTNRRGRPLTDRNRRPLTLVIPLERPYKVDGDEVEFKNTLATRLPSAVIRLSKDLKLRGAVVRVQDRRVLDTKKTSLKIRRRSGRGRH